jgi:hypothetical protein
MCILYKYLTEKQYFLGTFKAEVQRTEVQESFLAEVGNVQLGLEDSATSGKLGKDNLQRKKYFLSLKTRNSGV